MDNDWPTRSWLWQAIFRVQHHRKCGYGGSPPTTINVYTAWSGKKLKDCGGLPRSGSVGLDTGASYLVRDELQTQSQHNRSSSFLHVVPFEGHVEQMLTQNSTENDRRQLQSGNMSVAETVAAFLFAHSKFRASTFFPASLIEWISVFICCFWINRLFLLNGSAFSCVVRVSFFCQ